MIKVEEIFIKVNQVSFSILNHRENFYMEKHFDIFTAVNGLIGSKGKLTNALIPVQTKCLISLDRSHHLTKLVVLDIHEKQSHILLKQTLIKFCQKFWICSGRNFIRSVFRQSFICRTLSCKSYSCPEDSPP